jgi:hypothetical protein
MPRAVDGLLWSVAILSVGGVAFLSLDGDPPIVSLLPWDRAGHLVAYATITGSVLLAAVWRPGRGAGWWPGASVSAVVGAVVLGAVLEFAQGVVGRDPDVLDLAADAAGAGLAWAGWTVLRSRADKPRPRPPGRRARSRKEGITVLGWSAALVLGWGLLASAIQPVPRGMTAAPRTLEATSWEAEADAYVTAASPRRNFGTRRTLIVDGSPRTRSLLRFKIDETCDPVTGATLHLFAKRGKGARFSVRRVSDDWDEGSVTHRRAPRPVAQVRRSDSVRPNRWTTADVTPMVGQRHLASLILSSRDRRLTFSSREGARDPALVLETAPGLEPVPAAATPAPPVRGVYGSCSAGFDTVLAAGFNAVTVGAYREELDQLAAVGLQGVVWLGSWDDSTCSFEYDEEWVTSHVEAIQGHPAILAYQITDEPKASDCPTAPQEIRARSDLVKGIDPTNPTYVVIQASDGQSQHPYEKFAGTTDIMGIDIYPCSFEDGCRMEKIDQAVAALEQDGVPRYWALIQAFEDDYYRMPTATELHAQFARWRSSAMEGYFVFSLNYQDDQLETHRDLLAALRQENAA